MLAVDNLGHPMAPLRARVASRTGRGDGLGARLLRLRLRGSLPSPDCSTAPPTDASPATPTDAR